MITWAEIGVLIGIGATLGALLVWAATRRTVWAAIEAADAARQQVRRAGSAFQNTRDE